MHIRCFSVPLACAAGRRGTQPSCYFPRASRTISWQLSPHTRSGSVPRRSAFLRPAHQGISPIRPSSLRPSNNAKAESRVPEPCRLSEFLSVIRSNTYPLGTPLGLNVNYKHADRVFQRTPRTAVGFRPRRAFAPDCSAPKGETLPGPERTRGLRNLGAPALRRWNFQRTVIGGCVPAKDASEGFTVGTGGVR